MPFFLKPEAGSAVSELLEERLKRLQHQLQTSQQSCEGLSGEVESFTKSAREMCRRAGVAFGAFGAALDVEYARLEDKKKEMASWSGSEAHSNAATGALSKRRSSGAPRSSTEPLRSELLAMQLVECANEMEDDLREQVLQPMERVLASRGEVQSVIKERTRAADALAAAHNEYARAVARYEVPNPRSAKADQAQGPAAEMAQLGDRVVRASDDFAEAHGRAEEVLTRILEERGRCLRDAIASLKAAQTVFFVRAGHCVSSSVGQTPPPEKADNAEDSKDEEAGSSALTPPGDQGGKLKKLWKVKNQEPELPRPEMSGRSSPSSTEAESVDTAAASVSAAPNANATSDNASGAAASAIVSEVPAIDAVNDGVSSVPAGVAPSSPRSLEVIDLADAAPTEKPAPPVAENGEPPRRPSYLAKGAGSHIDDTKAGSMGGKASVVGSVLGGRGASIGGSDWTLWDRARNSGVSGSSSAPLGDSKRKKQSSWLRRLSLTFRSDPSESRESTGDWEDSLTPPPSTDPAGEVSDVPPGNGDAWKGATTPPKSSMHASAIGVSRGDDVPTVASGADVEGQKRPSEKGVEMVMSALEARDPASTGDLEAAGAGTEGASGADATEGVTEQHNVDDDEVRRSIYVSLFTDLRAKAESDREGEGEGERGGEAPPIDDLAETLRTGATRGLQARDLPRADNAPEGLDGSDSDETGSNSTEGFGPETAGTLFDGSDGKESFLFPRSPLPRSPRRPISGDTLRGDTAYPDGTENGGKCDGEADMDNAKGSGEKLAGSTAELPRARASREDAEEEKLPAVAGTTERDKIGAVQGEATPDRSTAGSTGGLPPPVVADVGVDRLNYDDGEQAHKKVNATDTGVKGGTERASTVSPSAGPRPFVRSRRRDRPSTLSSILTSTPDKDDPKTPSPLPPTSETMVTPPAKDGRVSPFEASPAVSEESSTRGSPRSWRLSGWWARASDRHRPPPPGTEDDFAGAAAAENLLGMALAAAAAGGDAVESALSQAGGSRLTDSGNGGDGRPVVKDDGGGGLGGEGAQGAVSVSDSVAILPTLSAEQVAASAAEACEAERRAWSQSTRRRMSKPLLSASRIVDHQPRAYEAAREYLNVVDLSRACGVCRGWAERLRGEAGEREWRRCVRLGNGVPSSMRARFYLHILYDQPSWLPKAHERRRIDGPRPNVYQERILEAEAKDEARTSSATAAAISGESDSQGGNYGDGGDGQDDCFKWLKEIDTDVLRTCPADTVPVSHEDQPSAGGDASGRWHLSRGRTVAATRVPDGEERGGAGGLVDEVAGGSSRTVTWSRSISGGGTRDKLRRLLRAFAVHNRRVSYCQGMNFVALALLDACSGDDEQAFWILSGMCDRLELEGLWCEGLERLDFCFYALDQLLQRHCPSLRQHLADEGVQLSMFTSRWFVTLFTCNDVFGRGTSRKILDMFLVERWPLIFKVSLGVLLEMRPLLEPADMEGILKITKFPRAQLFGLRRDGTGRHVAGVSFEEAVQGSLCESIRAGQIVEHALRLHASEETLEKYLADYNDPELELEPGSD